LAPVAANTVFTFWESSEFVSRDQRPTCNSGDLVRIEVTYNFQACFMAEIENTEEEENGLVCKQCSSDFMKYEQAISPCLADNDELKQVYTVEYNEWITACPCYIAGRNGKPDCAGCVLCCKPLCVALCAQMCVRDVCACAPAARVVSLRASLGRPPARFFHCHSFPVRA
jgi:hypothetical protein